MPQENPPNQAISGDFRGNVSPPDVTTDFSVGKSAHTIDEARWNKSYPFQLAILRAQDTGGYKLEQGWLFTLPIPPEELSIQTPSAIVTSVTLGGIVEQHNGTPIRILSFSGSTGVYPLRGQGEGLKTTLAGSTLGAIFAGTTQAISGVARGLTSVATGSAYSTPNLYEDKIDISSIAPRGTGYAQFRLLEKFLENYMAMMKDPANKDLRLAFLMWKNQAAFLVSPITFTVTKSASSPFEFRYNFQLKAWKKINPDDIGKTANANAGIASSARSPNMLAQVLNRINYARDVLADTRKAIDSIRPDFDASVGESLRETALLIKGSIGVSQTAADMPPSIIGGMRDTVAKGFNSIKQAIQSGDPRVQNSKDSISSLRNDLKSGVKTTVNGTNPANKLFSNPTDNAKLFSQMKLDLLSFPPAVRRQIISERARVRKLTRADFEKKRDTIIAFAADYANRVGVGHDTFNTIYGIGSSSATRTATDDDYKILFALNESAVQLGRMAAYTDVNTTNGFVSAIESIAGLARRSGIAFKVPTSKFAVPFPYGSTLEQLSLRYLKDPNRWHEIATLNGLMEPYVDEVGFDLSLLVNANGNTVVVSDASDLFIGQPVSLYAPSVGISKRRIVSITKVTDGYYAVLLDGTASISSYTTAASSKLHAFLPGTVNSQQVIYIPSDKAAGEDPRTKAVPGVNDFDHLLNVGGIDMLLTPTGDLAVTPDGDCRLSFGLTNLVQQAKIALSTPRGSLLQHPDYGLDIQVGGSNADFTAKDLLTAAKALFSNDSSYTGVESASIIKTGPTTSIFLQLGVAGSDTNIPISMEVA